MQITPLTDTRADSRLPPTTVLILTAVIGIAVALFVIWAAASPPWLGLSFASNPDGSATIIHAEGPGATIPVGTVLVSVAGGGSEMEFQPIDFTLEPDGTIDDYGVYQMFLERQGALARIQASETVTFTAADGRTFTIMPDLDGRPLVSLPIIFWAQLMVGLFGWLISSAVFAFRPFEASARYLLLSGGATMVFAPFAAIYTSREFALPTALFRWISDLNFFGGSIFTASLVALLLHYPKRLAPSWVGIAIVVLYVVWFIAQHVGMFESMTFARRFLVMIGVFTTFVLAGVHWYTTRKDPVARAALQWFLLSWMLGTTLFWLFILLPQSFGVDTTPVQGYGFLLFLLVYGGLAFGIMRYRLFELGEWWGRIVIWTLSILLLVVLDLVFLVLLQLSTSMSLSLALLVTGLVWLPLRALVWGRFLDRNTLPRDTLFKQVMDVALTPPGNDQSMRWKDVLQSVFDPLRMQSATRISAVSVGSDGLTLELPPIDQMPALHLEYARGGRSLFTPRDVGLAEELVAMLRHAIQSRSAYEQGVARERVRIARDMHDNIGAQLLGALHSADADRKNTLIRETFADLRNIIQDSFAPGNSLAETLSELRMETEERLNSAGVKLHWTMTTEEYPGIAPPSAHEVRSIVREAVSNVIKHARASSMNVAFHYRDGLVSLQIDDDGVGFDLDARHSGNGLASMQTRVESLGGTYTISRQEKGMRIAAEFPLAPMADSPTSGLDD